MIPKDKISVKTDNSDVINPGLDISLHLLPLDLKAVFGNGNDCLLEIGFGDGDFLVESALRNPGNNYLGLEIKKRRVNKAVKRARRQRAVNVRFIHMDAEIAAGEIFRPDSFSTAYINFPDPWPKDRHKQHRIINRGFLKKLSGIMKQRANLEIASDHGEYVLNTLDTMRNIAMFDTVYPEPGYISDIPDRTETSYEKEFRAEGRQIHYMKFRNKK